MFIKNQFVLFPNNFSRKYMVRLTTIIFIGTDFIISSGTFNLKSGMSDSHQQKKKIIVGIQHFSRQKLQYLHHCCSDKGLKGTVVNRINNSLHEESLETMLTVSFILYLSSTTGCPTKHVSWWIVMSVYFYRY